MCSQTAKFITELYHCEGQNTTIQILSKPEKTKLMTQKENHLSLLVGISSLFHYHIIFCQNWTIFIRTIQNAIGTRHFNIGTVRTASYTVPQNF